MDIVTFVLNIHLLYSLTFSFIYTLNEPSHLLQAFNTVQYSTI